MWMWMGDYPLRLGGHGLDPRVLGEGWVTRLDGGVLLIELQSPEISIGSSICTIQI